ncbi:hypothetical protein [Meridianimarinicoccus roseus]|jgi:hypothetical protein|uniref:hypothetical protein n=1 Tax=Meridianimarinicoccus roseus TaxID=2072018 RepID=UPI001EE670F9|nr:hypothetical protein [Meridianimarinicoccus roseus]
MLGIIARSLNTAARGSASVRTQAQDRAALEMEARRHTLFLGRPVLPRSERRE